MTTTKKVVTKKSVASKKVGTKAPVRKTHKNAKRVLVQANDEQCFWTNDGTIITSLIELSNVLSSIREDVYKYHATREKNDFADWVQYVLGDAELAKTLRTARTPKSARTFVIRRLKIYDI
jgi:hypothetical protein